jgi:hypothetical protein
MFIIPKNDAILNGKIPLFFDQSCGFVQERAENGGK